MEICFILTWRVIAQVFTIKKKFTELYTSDLYIVLYVNYTKL